MEKNYHVIVNQHCKLPLSQSQRQNILVDSEKNKDCDNMYVKQKLNDEKANNQNKQRYYRNRSIDCSLIEGKAITREQEEELQRVQFVRIHERLDNLQKRIKITEQFLNIQPPISQSKQLPINIAQLISQISTKNTQNIEHSFNLHLSQFQKFKQNIKQDTNQPLTSPTSQNIVTKIQNQHHQLQQKLQVMFQNLQNQIMMNKKQIYLKIKKISKIHQQINNTEKQFFRTNRKYSGNPISFLYEEFIRKIENSENEERIRINKITYYVDCDGFLLDNEGLYLVDGSNQEIRLSEKQLKMLRKHNILTK